MPDANAVRVTACAQASTLPTVVDDDAASPDGDEVNISAAMGNFSEGLLFPADDGEAPTEKVTTGMTASVRGSAAGVPATKGTGEVASSHEAEADNDGSVLVGEWLYYTEDEEESDTDGDDDDTIGAAAVDLLAALPRHMLLSSTASRIRAYYLEFLETSHSNAVVPLSWASCPSRFCSPALRGALLCALTAGGCGLSERDHVAYAQSLCAVEQEATRGTSLVVPVSAAFPSAHDFLTATRHEQNRVLSTRHWMVVTIEIGGRSFVYYYRDVF